MRYNRHYFCPSCDWQLQIDQDAVDAEEVTCPHCESVFAVDTDAEFDDGRWHDRTTLHLIKRGVDHTDGGRR